MPQALQLLADLRKRGAHLRDGMKQSSLALYLLYLQIEMKTEEDKFAAS